ncbi:uncharacterized protein LOC132472565 [Gadus macrocephalus]|uniref:uncharacterized protein LOC132472565 n=1 Tax=Gadus macrocephalus TaxID=80720 RepID=UPI0028CB2069|nr:uncharacterized protein LOC132472565 [Gadus macrocephalus]
MAAVSLFTWVFLQAVLLLDVHCRPVKMGPYFMNNAGYTAGRSSQGPAFMVKGGSTGGGSYSPDPAFYQHEEPEAPGDYGTSSAAALPSGKSNSHPSLTDSAQAIAWVIPPSVYSGHSKSGQGGAASGSAPSHAMPGPQFVPGELFQLESTMDTGRVISETQERGNPPPPPPPWFAGNTEVFNSPPAQEASMPSSPYGYYYPYDFMFVTGQYPPGTYAQASSSFEKGGDEFIENHYVRYEYPDGPGKEHPMQPYPGDAWHGMGKGMPNH